MSGSGPAVRLESVSVRFGGVQALDRASFSVPYGSITGLVGRNGAGKSTSIHVIAGLLAADEGGCTVLGTSYDDGASAIRRDTGFLLSEPALFAYLTPPETLRFLAEAYRVPAAEAERRVADLLEFFELGEAAKRTVGGFSTGMLKRLALAAAMIHAPALLVLDEPFESLDPLLVRRIKRLLVDYARGGGTVLLSSHLLDAVDEVCDRVVIVEGGQVVVEAAAGEAMDAAAGRLGRGTLEELYASVVRSGVVQRLDWFVPDRSHHASPDGI
jgi:ABC-2 type transport system ATP-binding protein